MTPTAEPGSNTQQVATCAFSRGEVSNLVGAAPTTLDTLNPLATTLGNDASYSTTVTNTIATNVSLLSISTSPGIVGEITKQWFVDNATDVGKPLFAAAQTALYLKASVSSPTFLRYSWWDYQSKGCIE